MSIEQIQSKRIEQLESSLDQAMALTEKLQRQKGYLVDLLIKDISPSTTVIINKYLDWLEEDERQQ
jgi:phage-related protein